MIDDIRRAIGLLTLEGGVVEVRALADGVTHSGYFDDHALLSEQIEALDADPSVAGIYVTLNDVNPALLARRANRIKMRLSRKDATTADADIIRRRWFPVDIDPVRPSGVSSTDEEHNAALNAAERIAAYLAEQGFPASIRADSGNGAHLLYRIDLPNDAEATALVKGCLATLDALFSNEAVTVDTANHNAARIWKLYGTMSRKGDSTPERPHRRARILSLPSEISVVPPERLRHLAGLLPREDPAASRPKAGIDLAAWLAEYGIAVRSTRPWQGGTLFTLAECPFSSAHKDGAFAIQFVNGAIFAGCHHASCSGGAQRWPELRGMYEKKRRKPEEKTPGKKEQEEKTTSPPPADEHRERALTILRDGDPLAFLLDTFNKSHVGDRTVAECLAMSLASQSVENTNGLHVAVSGNSGKGKTHACTTMQNLIPAAYKLKGTVSDKALYYDDDLRPGTVLLFDDVSLSDDLQEVLKSATANFREPIEHRTLTTERKLRVCTIPERCVWWLAKVEDLGGDQVMNRMLTVWIDDTVEQDKRVFEHMKEVEAAGRGPAKDDVLTCRAIWEIVKEDILSVRIPFARRIQFSTMQNRRNPGMLFDLIKCRARLFFLQRDRDDDGAVIARPEDFAAAATLYSAINGEAGGQETKLTKNEAAALATVAQMGIEVFTVRQLQSALGLPYQRTYRLLHGYTNNRATYAGLLEKCPAVSYIDATVTGEMIGVGETVRRREHYFSFDREVYRTWSNSTTVWLDDGPDDRDGGPHGFTFSPGLHQKSGESVNEDPVHDGGDCSIGEICTEICIDQSGNLHRLPGTESLPAGAGDATSGVHEIHSGENIPDIPGQILPIREPAPYGGFSRCKSGCKGVKTSVNVQPSALVNPADYIALPVPKDEPCHVCGRRPTSSVRRGGGGTYLCYDCLKRAKWPAKAQPLPGVLDHRTFTRTKVEIGRCDICGEKKAVYRSQEAHTRICEGCYARMVREWNGREGVR
ncbi:hypothetical protein F8E02_10660 [Methanoculleus sp. Wushi-C6]|uniref:Uncharacterized protein n=1 Tax=Methanoculleus caldifontis TaxID=2651577 RepID=A0ABU3X325_9EURY|nr:hypothetical protein [Methanoculleus sp. Wushi-C6]MDV2482452.1 hypothetical protein [Methanoculleus sp. Wushi-C6]